MKPLFFLFRLVVLLWMGLNCGAASAQIRKGDALRNRIDSLNRVAFDHPVPVIKMADSLAQLALRQKRPIDYGLLLQVKGVAETSLGHNAEALGFHMKSYRVFDSIGQKEGKIFALTNIATVHINLGNFKKAEDYLLKALAITDPKDNGNLRTIYVNLGVACDMGDNSKRSVAYYHKAIPYLQQLNDYNGLAINYHNIAEAYMRLNDFGNAEASELRALAYQKKSGSKNTLAMISLSLGHLYGQNNELQKSRYYLDIGGKMAYELDSPYYKETYYEAMANWYEATGDYKNSHLFLQKLVVLRDTIHSEESLEANVRMEEQFQNSLKTKEIELLKVQKKLDAATIEKNTFWRIVLLVISMLCLVIIVVLFRNYKLKQKANLMLSREKNQLAEQNLQLENENILVQFETLKNQVSPHFLFNSLNALASLISTNPEKAVKFTNVFSKIFRNTLELKDRHLLTLREELQHVNAYLSLQKMRFGNNLSTDISVPSERLNDYLPPFSLQMVVENAIKHNSISSSEPLTIRIGVKDEFLVVTNNLQPRQFVEDSTGTGVRNIRSRYKYVTALEPVFEIRNQEYHVELPLIKEE